MKITVYGPGCDKCKRALANVEAAVAQSGVAVEIEKVDKVADISQAGILFTPGVAVDGVIKTTGKVPEIAKILQWINEQ